MAIVRPTEVVFQLSIACFNIKSFLRQFHQPLHLGFVFIKLPSPPLSVVSTWHFHCSSYHFKGLFSSQILPGNYPERTGCGRATIAFAGSFHPISTEWYLRPTLQRSPTWTRTGWPISPPIPLLW